MVVHLFTEPPKEKPSEAAFVSAVEIPPFKTMPSVLMWGTRTFKLWRGDEGGISQYVECFAVAIVSDPLPVPAEVPVLM